MNNKLNCVICSNKLIKNVVNLGKLPICEDFRKINNKYNKIKRYKTRLDFCKQCYTLFQNQKIDQKKIFPKSYKYRARFTKDVLAGMKDLSKTFFKNFKFKKNDYICDIGCNDGSLLNFFKGKMKTIGVEPTFASKDAKICGHKVFSNYFDEKIAIKIKKETRGKLRLITFTNVFAHITNFKKLVKSLNIILNPNTILVIENHYLGSILKNNQFDTFYSEHPRTYSFKSFKYIAKLLDCKIIKLQFPSRYGGNIRVFLKKINNNHKNEIKFNEYFIKSSIFKLQKKINIWRKKSQNTLKILRKKKILLYGKSLPARAVVLINMLKIDEKIMPIIFEKEGSKKIGYYVPGTKIKILSDKLWINKKVLPENMIIWGWHIFKEIQIYLKKNGNKSKLYLPFPYLKKKN